MNIHPIIVHFPIALLSMYAVFEWLRFAKLQQSREWFYIKASFLLFGSIGALLAVATGDFGKSLYHAQRTIIQVHERFAAITVLLFGIIALLYLLTIIDNLLGDALRRSSCARLWESIMRVEKKLFTAPLLVSLATLGLLALFITGALGGSIVYGATSDPFAQLVNKLFVPR